MIIEFVTWYMEQPDQVFNLVLIARGFLGKMYQVVKTVMS